MENIKKKRIGTFTLGLTLIVFGISIVIQTFSNFDLLKYLLMFWPLVFISIGGETIYYLVKKDIEIKYDFAGILLTIFLLLIGGIMSLGNYTVNKILYDPEISNSINELSNNIIRYYYVENLNGIINHTDIPVNIQTIESIDSNNRIQVKYNLKNNNDTISNLINKCIAEDVNYVITTNEELIFNNISENIENIDVILYTNNKDIKISNCNII